MASNCSILQFQQSARVKHGAATRTPRAVATMLAKAPHRNNLHNFACRSGRAAALLVVAIARYDSSSRLASPPATTAKLHKLFLRGALLRGMSGILAALAVGNQEG